ncbi:chemotaxis protein [Antarctobacter jejuensis]|uniref:chemotaxis protein n=1 Tax=Antarctobacter jejuensis TaxID=1439938 RepID=UPI003FD25B5D
MNKEVEFTLPLRDATQRASSELEGLYIRLERLEHALDSLVLHSSDALDSTSIELLQELDMLRQSIGALADFLGQVSQETDSSGMVNASRALQAVPLRDMATRLGGRTKATTKAGHAELF